MTAELSDELQNLIERFKSARDSRLFAPLADAYRKSGNVDMAIEVLERGIERYPDYASAHVILGKCYYDKGASERAKAEFLRVVEIDPENMVALKFLGDILLAEDARRESSEYYRKVLAIDPTNAEVAKTLKEMESAVPPRDIDLGDRTTTRDERPRELASMTLAGIYAAQGYYNKALRIYGEVLEREPRNKEALEMAGKLRAIIDASSAERGKAFDEDVLTISVDDVSEDVAASTAGPGGAQPQAEGPSSIAGEIRAAIGEIGARQQPPADMASEAGARGAESTEEPQADRAEGPHSATRDTAAPSAETTGDSSPDAGRREPGPGTGDDLAHFQEWVKRLKKQ